VFVLEDGTVLVKKAGGETVVLNADDTVDYVDKDGQVQAKKDTQKGIQLDLQASAKNKFKQVAVADLNTHSTFWLAHGSHLERHNGNLWEVLADNSRLQILPNGSKRRAAGVWNETC